jgi:hypothetical protein
MLWQKGLFILASKVVQKWAWANLPLMLVTAYLHHKVEHLHQTLQRIEEHQHMDHDQMQTLSGALHLVENIGTAMIVAKTAPPPLEDAQLAPTEAYIEDAMPSYKCHYLALDHTDEFSHSGHMSGPHDSALATLATVRRHSQHS